MTLPLHARWHGALHRRRDRRGLDRLQEAVAAIAAGRGTIASRLALPAMRGAGRRPYRLRRGGARHGRLRGGACEARHPGAARKAARGRRPVFTGIRVHDGNGAGIRLEEGDLIVSYTLFSDSQSGILSADDRNGSIAIDHSPSAALVIRRPGSLHLHRRLRRSGRHELPLRARQGRPLSEEPRAAHHGARQQLRRQSGAPPN